MESRRTTRGGPTTRRIATRSSPARVSPVRATRSPARRSPARTRAESNKPISPKHKRAPSTQSNAGEPRARGRPKRVVPAATIPEVVQPTAATSNDNAPANNTPALITSPRVSLTRENLRQRTPLSQTAVTTKTSITTTASRVKVTAGSDDVNVNKLAAEYVEAARAKLERMVTPNRFTPTPSEMSRQSDRGTSRSVSRSFIDDDEDDEEPSDNDRELYQSFQADEKYRYGSSSYAQRKILQEFNRTAAFLWILIASIAGFYLQFTCKRKRCFPVLPEAVPALAELNAFFTLNSMYLYLGLTWSIFALSALPFIRRTHVKTDRGYVSYSFNGLECGVLSLIGLALATYLKYPFMATIYRNYQQLVAIAILYALVLSAWCYLRSKRLPDHLWNPYASSGRAIADYFAGREINPRWFGVIDIKLVHHRIAVVAALVINAMFLYKSIRFAALPVVEGAPVNWTISEQVHFAYANAQYDTMPVVSALMALLYVVDMLWNEHHLTRSFELHGEGVGAQLLLRYALFPFGVSLMTKYAFEHKLMLVPTWAVYVMLVLFVFGLIVKRRSNQLKFNYRQSPEDPMFTELSTLPTFQGRRLIVCSYWGLVRHPNYVGDMICSLAMAMPLIWHFAWNPAIWAAWSVGQLVHRAHRVSTRNYNRYNSAWTRYCQHVTRKFVPGVY